MSNHPKRFHWLWKKKPISRPLLHSHVRVGQNPRKRLQGELGNLKVYTSMLECFFERKNASPLTEYILKPRFAQQNYEADFFFKGKCNQGCVNVFVNCSDIYVTKNCDFMLVRAVSIFRKAKCDTRIKLTMDIFDIVAI